MNKPLEEKSILDLEKKIRELEEIALSNNVDLSKEIETLKNKMINMKSEVYQNLSPWKKVEISRLQNRPSTLDYISRIFTDFIEFHGDRAFGDDSSIVGGIGVFKDIPVTIIGHQKGKDTIDNIKRNFGMPHPEGYRKALRLMKQGEKFKRPVIMFIDTPGAFCGLGAEERGQGHAIATNLFEMSSLKTPIIVIVIGQGGSGGALALGLGDRIAMLEHSIYSVISPEGLASILWKDSSLSKEASKIMKLTSKDLLEYNIIDEIIEEPLGGAHNNIDETSDNIKKYLSKEVFKLLQVNEDVLLKNRYEKIRSIGIWKEE